MSRRWSPADCSGSGWPASTDAEIPESLKAVEQRVTERGPGAHPMTGPIFVEGAEPGDTLEVQHPRIGFLHDFGVNALQPRRWHAARRLSLRGSQAVPLDPRRRHASTFAPGVTLPLAPFFGSIGVAPPPLVGRISSRPPGWHGGNLDNKDLVAGSTLYLPVHVAGALLSIGDGHALQGDGEVTGTALETSLRGTVEVRAAQGPAPEAGRAPRRRRTTSPWGCTKTSTRRRALAMREMIDFLVAEKKMSRDDAYMLCSLAADLHVTQVVDATKGVHATLAKSMFSADYFTTFTSVD